MAVWIL